MAGVITWSLFILLSSLFFFLIAFLSWRESESPLSSLFLLGYGLANFCTGMGGLADLPALSLLGAALLFCTMFSTIFWWVRCRTKAA